MLLELGEDGNGEHCIDCGCGLGGFNDVEVGKGGGVLLVVVMVVGVYILTSFASRQGVRISEFSSTWEQLYTRFRSVRHNLGDGTAHSDSSPRIKPL